MKNKPLKFLELAESFINKYLPIAVGASPNTIKSYTYALRLLLEYLHSEHGLCADCISFEQLDYECITGFLEWLEAERHCIVSTKNQRISALLSFSEYAQNRDFGAAAVFRGSLLQIPAKKGNEKCRTVFTVPEVTILLQMPNEKGGTGIRDKVLFSLMYASGARAQEICNLTVGNVCFNSNRAASLVFTGKGESSADRNPYQLFKNAEKIHRISENRKSARTTRFFKPNT